MAEAGWLDDGNSRKLAKLECKGGVVPQAAQQGLQFGVARVTAAIV